jgi:hypothetical protein
MRHGHLICLSYLWITLMHSQQGANPISKGNLNPPEILWMDGDQACFPDGSQVFFHSALTLGESTQYKDGMSEVLRSLELRTLAE